MNRSLILSIFRGRLLRAAGLGALAPFLCTYACGGTAVVDPDETASGGGGASSTTASSATASTTTATNASSTTTGGGGAGGSTMSETVCFLKGDEALPCPDLADAPQVFGPCSDDTFEWIATWISGPEEIDGACCYEVVLDGPCGVGRPLVLAETAVTAPKRRGPSPWTSPLPPSGDRLGEAERSALAEGWLHDGLFEHASAASFARFALELMSLGAPPELVAAAHQAAADEVRHAELCFALASRYAGEPLGPGPLDVSKLALRTDLATLARETVLEGCIGETIAALVAEAQRAGAEDGAVRDALEIIARDEARHAELAWKTVAWALRSGDDGVRRAVREAFAIAKDHLPAVHSASGLAAHGRLDAETTRRLVADALSEVVLPCAGALLAESEA